jgi:hypothetical protein
MVPKERDRNRAKKNLVSAARCRLAERVMAPAAMLLESYRFRYGGRPSAGAPQSCGERLFLMKLFQQKWVFLMGAAVVLAVGLAAAYSRPAAAVAADDKVAGGSPRYAVVETQATNLVVVDNQTNTLYFYTVEKEGQPGEDLKLRGSADLNQVGKPVIKIAPAKKP